MEESGPILDKKCVRLLNTAPSHEILRKIYFLGKPLKNGLNREWSFCKKGPFFVNVGRCPNILD